MQSSDKDWMQGNTEVNVERVHEPESLDELLRAMDEALNKGQEPRDKSPAIKSLLWILTRLLTEEVEDNSRSCNGHLSNTVAQASIHEVQHLLEFLEKVMEQCFILEYWADRSAAIFQKDYWEEGEHSLDHKDRLILNIEEVYFHHTSEML